VLKNTRKIGRSLRRALGSVLLRIGCLLVFATAPASAERDPAECIQTHANAQEQADKGRLFEARRLFESCATNDCPKLIQADCKTLGKAVEKSTPTLNLTVLDHNGGTPAELRIEVDGVLLPTDASKQPIALDPGERRFKLSAPGYPDADVTILVKQKEKNQTAVVRFAAPDPIASKVRTAGYVFAGISAVGILSFTGFAISGYADQHRLESSASRIDDSNLRLADRMHHKYAISDMSLGIGLVSLGAATFLLYVTRNSPESATPMAKTAVYFRGSADGGGLVLKREF